jgi:hypothetical protein
MEAKKSKLLDQFTKGAEKECDKQDKIFQGISLFVNGYTSTFIYIVKLL